MAGRARHFARDESVRHRVFERTRDPHGVDSSQDLRQSHTAPSGLPATRSGDVFSILGVKGGKIQENWEKNVLSEYSLQKEFVKGEVQRKIDENGKAGYKFQLSMLFPPIKEMEISSTNWSRRFFQLPLWRWIAERVENTRDSIPGLKSPVDEFAEQTRVALLAYQVLTKSEGLGTMNFRNAGEKKWIKENRRAMEDQIGNFVRFGRRSFYIEVRHSEHINGRFEDPVRSAPDRETLIRVELKQFLSFIILGIKYEQPLNSFQDDQDRHHWKTTYEAPDSARSVKRLPLRKKLGSKPPPPPSPPELPPPPSPPPSAPPPATEAEETAPMDDSHELPTAIGAKEGGTLKKIRTLQFISPGNNEDDSEQSSEFSLEDNLLSI